MDQKAKKSLLAEMAWRKKEQKQERGKGDRNGQLKVPKKQVEEKQRVVNPRRKKQLAKKRACKSKLGGQTYC